MANRAYEDAQTRFWSRTVDGYDGFVWAAAEYNFGVPAALKNALDVLYPEWNHKAVGFVAYGADGGVRAVEHWRSVVANVRMIAVRAQVSLSLFHDWQCGEFVPLERRAAELARVLDELEEMAVTLEPVRVSDRHGASRGCPTGLRNGQDVSRLRRTPAPDGYPGRLRGER